MNSKSSKTHWIKSILLSATLILGYSTTQAAVTDDLKSWLRTPAEQRGNIADCKFAQKALSAEEAQAVKQMLQDAHRRKQIARYSEIWKTQTIQRDTLTMRFMYRIYGEKPADGRSLYISMHGGGGTAPEVNDQQWKNQIALYRPAEGVYVAPRSLHNVWNMWFLPYLDGFYDELIQSAVEVMGVNPDKVYITGYSAGGDGTFRMAPRMADRWAAALMCAGHPADTSPVSLLNLPFGMWVGLQDGAYDRNLHAAEWCGKLQALHEANPDGYLHNVKLPNTGHWMNRQDTAAFHWMGQFRRTPYPKKIAWKQDNTYLNYTMYWLITPPGKAQPGGLITAERYGNEIEIGSCYADEIIVCLNDEMIDYTKPVVVRHQGKVVFSGKVKRTVADLYASFTERYDDRYCFPTRLTIQLNKQ